MRAAYGHSKPASDRVAPRGAESEIPTWGMAKKSESKARRHPPRPLPPRPTPPPPRTPPSPASRRAGSSPLSRSGRGGLYGYRRPPSRSKSISPTTPPPYPSHPPFRPITPDPTPDPTPPAPPPTSPPPPELPQWPADDDDDLDDDSMEAHRRRAMVAFEQRHAHHLQRVEGLYHHLAIAREVSRGMPLEMLGAYDESIRELYRNRWFCPEVCVEPCPLTPAHTITHCRCHLTAATYRHRALIALTRALTA